MLCANADVTCSNSLELNGGRTTPTNKPGKDSQLIQLFTSMNCNWFATERRGKGTHSHGICVIEILREIPYVHREGEQWNKAYRS